MKTTFAGPRPFAWSYSKLKNFETCPKRHYHVDIAKDVKEELSEQLTYGNEVHDALAKRIAKGTPLPRPYAAFEKWVEWLKVDTGTVLVEQKYAFKEDFSPCGYFDRDVWYRGIGDVVKIVGPVALIADWKTGKIGEDATQLALMAQCVFSHFPDVQKVRSEFIWLKEDATSREDFAREDMPGLWAALLPRIRQLKHAADTDSYPAKPGFLCRRWCPVQKCPHHGE